MTKGISDALDQLVAGNPATAATLVANEAASNAPGLVLADNNTAVMLQLQCVVRAVSKYTENSAALGAATNPAVWDYEENKRHRGSSDNHPSEPKFSIITQHGMQMEIVYANNLLDARIAQESAWVDALDRAREAYTQRVAILQLQRDKVNAKTAEETLRQRADMVAQAAPPGP